MPFGNTFVQVYTGNALCKYVFRHKTCYSEEQLQQELSKTGAFTEKNRRTGTFEKNSVP